MQKEVPPPPPVNLAAKVGVNKTKSEQVFIVSGTTVEDVVFEFPDTEKMGSLPLRMIIRQYLGSPHSRQFQAKQLHLILGRLRCLLYCIDKYNDGVKNPTPSFLQYWKRRALDQLSGFGFQVANNQELISVVGLRELIENIELVFEKDIQASRELISNGLITFDSLSELYLPGKAIQGRTSLGGTSSIFMLVESYYEERRSLMGMEKSFHWSMEFIASMGKHFTVVRFTEVLSGWTGVRARSLTELIYVPLDSKEYVIYQARGKKYLQYATGDSNYVSHKANSFFIHSSGSRQNQTSSLSKSGSSLINYPGRIMIDTERGSSLGHHPSQGNDEPSLAMLQVAGRYRRWKNSQITGSSNSANGTSLSQDSMLIWDSVPDELLIYCWPALVGFSFTAKSWGHVLVDGLEEIQFQDLAFDNLVLEPEKKELIKALVKYGGDRDTEDIVGGKCGGSIFLLHGPPGVGKTLTAEAIAEVLHRPLYYVTMGELGMTPEDMEKRLSDVLELCDGWNALTLLDEADVFLETRSTSDIVRNAMVCVMLRLLEYHPGILFLTTNRVRSFDPAFESRVTVALRYENLTPEARSQVWSNLLERVSVPKSSDIDHIELGKHILNGRQIKNAVKLAVSLSKEKNCELSQSILEKTLQITTLGRNEMKNDTSWTPDN